MISDLNIKMRERLGEQEYTLFIYLFKLFLIWLSWKVIILVLGEESTPIETLMFPQLTEAWRAFNLNLVYFLLDISRDLLWSLDYLVYTEHRSIWIENVPGVGVGNYCLGLQLIYYIVCLILISSMSFFMKMLGIGLSVVITFLLNIGRISVLTLISYHLPDYLFLAHDHIFNIIVFGTLIAMYWGLMKFEKS